MPMSIPTTGPRFGTGSGIAISHGMETDQQAASWLTVAVFILPFNRRCWSHSTQPALGRKMRPAAGLNCLGQG
jgi:hypothetical protein